MLEWIQAADGAALLWIQETVRHSLIDPLVMGYTRLGDMGLLWIALSLLMLCFAKTRRAGALSLGAMLLGMLCTNVALKHLVGRARPYLVVEGLIPLLLEGDPNSFPSGYTCAAFAAAGAWCRALPWRWMRIGAAALAALMGISRLYVGVHYPSDVLAGLCIGVLCSQLAWLLARRWEKRPKKPE